MSTVSGHTSAIRAKKVLGTAVTDAAGQKIGEIEDIVLDKESNNIMFAVVSFGGFLGIGDKYHPVPWSMLDYNPEAHSYVVSATREQLQSAPSDSVAALTRNDGRAFRDSAFSYYDAPRYW
jgi:sporulation protein YlmC with PRC-barrel domain